MFLPAINLISEEFTEHDLLGLAKDVRKLSDENSEMFSTMIKYAFRLLIVEALDSSELPNIDDEWEKSVTVILSSTSKSKSSLKRYLT
jgi:hypothetical protein